MPSPFPWPSWRGFLDTISTKSDGSWIFRGQTDASWELSPSVGRPDVCGTVGYRLDDEKEYFRRFMMEAPRWEHHLKSKLEWLALAQHHGLPTRLLDWSTNPLVAAWFACEKEAGEIDGAIHMIRFPKSAIVNDTDDFDPFDADKQVLVRVPARAARITAQQGLFSLHPRPNIPWNLRASGFIYDKIVVPHMEKPFFRKILHVLGTNRSRLMSDLDAVCATLSWEYRTQRIGEADVPTGR